MRLNIEIEAETLQDALTQLGSAAGAATITLRDVVPVAEELKAVADELKATEGAKAPTIDESEVDADGIIWDKRIHSSNHKKSPKGFWQRRRNTDDALFDSVMAELKGETEAPPAAAGALPTDPPGTPPADVAAAAPPETVYSMSEFLKEHLIRHKFPMMVLD